MQPLQLWILTVAAVIAALAVVLFVSLGTYTRRSTVAGQLMPSKGLVTVVAPETGVIRRMDVTEGEQVTAGKMLAIVAIPRATPNGGDTTAALNRGIRQRREGLHSARKARQKVLSAQASGLAAQLLTAQQELTQLNAEIATRQDQVRIANETLSRLRQLQADGYVSLIQIKQQESAALEQISAAQALQRQAIGMRRTLAQLKQAISEIPAQQEAAEANFRRDLAVLEQEKINIETRDSLAITAPTSGVIATQLIKAGQAVQAGQPLLNILPQDGELEAELHVPSHAIGFVEQGDTVLLRYQAYPYQKFGHHVGRVTRISRNAIRTTDPTNVGAPSGGTYYRLTVELKQQTVTAYGEQEPLKPGMLLEADILGDNRSLLEWALEPILSLDQGGSGQ